MEQQATVINHDKRNLQNLSLMFQTCIENCISQTDWENRQQSQKSKENLYTKLMKIINQIFSRIGGLPAINQQNMNQFNPLNELPKDPKINCDDLTDNTVANQNTSTSTPQDISQETQKQIKEDHYRNNNFQNSYLNDVSHQKHNQATINKNNMEEQEEVNKCQQIRINAHPFKQQLAHQKQRNTQQAKQSRTTSEEEYDPDRSSDSDFNGSDDDDDFGTNKKRKPIHKKRTHVFPYGAESNDHQIQYKGRPRGRPPRNYNYSDASAQSISNASPRNQKKVLQLFKQHFNPQKRNKIYVIEQIGKQFNYSYSSLYHFIRKEYNEKYFLDNSYEQYDDKQSHPQNDFKQNLMKQQKQQNDYYLNNQHQQQKNELPQTNRYRIPSHQNQDQQYFHGKDERQIWNDGYSKDDLKQNNSQFNKQMDHRDNQQQQQHSGYYQQRTQQQQNNLYQRNESESEYYQNQNNNNQIQMEDEMLFQTVPKKTASQQHHQSQQKQYDQKRFDEASLQNQKAALNNNRLKSSENRPPSYNDIN